GDGSDHLRGRSGDDLLIAGRTTHDDNDAELLQILNEWSSIDSYVTRIDKLRNGTGGLPKLDASTVTDDGVRDGLAGGSGVDWFFAGIDDRIRDKRANEQVN